MFADCVECLEYLEFLEEPRPAEAPVWAPFSTVPMGNRFKALVRQHKIGDRITPTAEQAWNARHRRGPETLRHAAGLGNECDHRL